MSGRVPLFPIARRASVRHKDALPDGSAASRSFSAIGVVVRIHPGATSYRAFSRFCWSLGVVFRPVATVAGADDSYNGRGALATDPDGKPIPVKPDVFRLIGTRDALRAVCTHESVKSWEVAVAVPVPTRAAGSGPAKR